jgi:hypothetical protein
MPKVINNTLVPRKKLDMCAKVSHQRCRMAIVI